MFKRHSLPGGVTGYQMGRGAKPPMTVWAYRLGGTLIDSGTPNMLGEFLPAVLADGPLTHIYVTHHHEDHSGGAARLRELTGAAITLSSFCAPLTRSGFRQHLYQHLMWGRFRPYQEDHVLELSPLDSRRWHTPDGDFTVIHTPGHSFDMTVVYDADRRILFSADLYLGTALRVMRRDEVWAALKASLRRVLASTQPEYLYCSHRPLARGGQAALAKKLLWMERSETAYLRLRGQGLGRSAAAKVVFGPRRRGFERVTLGDATQLNMAASLEGDLTPRRDVEREVGEAWVRCRFQEGSYHPPRL